ncbi:MAG TPA: hypothetical protein VE010_17395 [Thermoanaerobaculia bacterium]|nr:hypothetical protein [Thermoanaerobaculia bacterium]
MRNLIVIAACLATLSCSSGGATGSTGADAGLNRAALMIVQLEPPRSMTRAGEEIEVRYGVRATNNTAEEITLRRLILAPSGSGGPYVVQRQQYFFTHAIPAHSIHEFEFWAKAVTTGNPQSIDARAPVTVRATAHFESAGGPFRKTITQHVNQ